MPRGQYSRRPRPRSPYDYLLYTPKPLGTTITAYSLPDRIQNIRYALGCTWTEMGWMTGFTITTLSNAIAGRSFPTLAVERAIRRVEFVFAEEIQYYLESPRTRDRFRTRFKVTGVFQRY